MVQTLGPNAAERITELAAARRFGLLSCGCNWVRVLSMCVWLPAAVHKNVTGKARGVSAAV